MYIGVDGYAVCIMYLYVLLCLCKYGREEKGGEGGSVISHFSTLDQVIV